MVKTSSPLMSADHASSRPLGLTSSAPKAKKGWPSASAFWSRIVCSPSPAPAPSRSSAAVRRTWMGYDSPSTVRARYHQSPFRTGAERSVSWVRPLISSKMASDKAARSANQASVNAFSASR
jgi:hypothetical protein